MKILKMRCSILVILAFILVVGCVPPKELLEEQTGGADTSDNDEYTEFAAKGIEAKTQAVGVFTFAIQIEGNGEGQVSIDDLYVCHSANVRCDVTHKGPNVVLKASYDVSKYFFAGYKGVNCLPVEPSESNVCKFTLGDNETVVTATFDTL